MHLGHVGIGILFVIMVVYFWLGFKREEHGRKSRN